MTDRGVNFIVLELYLLYSLVTIFKPTEIPTHTSFRNAFCYRRFFTEYD